MEINIIYNMDCLNGLKTLPSSSLECCITSPPYWRQRNYEVEEQLGQEETPEEYISKLVIVFREVKRLLKPNGTLWLNLGDKYCSTAPNTIGDKLHIKEVKANTQRARKLRRPKTPNGLKPKDLMGLPWRVAFALQADGWYLRQDIIWHKPNCTPESVKDRCTKAHEYIFLLSKSRKYYYDNEVLREKSIWAEKDKRFINGPSSGGKAATGRYAMNKGGAYSKDGKRNKRSVWNIPTANTKDAHFAVFPEKLILPCVLAGCPVGGTVLDPFMGSGTTAIVATKNDRNFIGYEINPEYVQICNRRLKKQ